MAFVVRLLDRLDLDPVVGMLLVCLLAARLVVLWVTRRARRGRSADQLTAADRKTDQWTEWLDAGLLAMFVVYLVVRPFVAQVAVVTSSSMAPTLNGTLQPEVDGPADRLLISRLTYLLRTPQRGEVVVFRLSQTNTLLERGVVVKRVIAVAGDTVEMNLQGRVVVNGRVLDERYTSGPSDRVLPAQQVPAGTVFVLGDNRRYSRDSSRFERSPFVPANTVRGKALAVCWPLARMRMLRPE